MNPFKADTPTIHLLPVGHRLKEPVVSDADRDRVAEEKAERDRRTAEDAYEYQPVPRRPVELVLGPAMLAHGETESMSPKARADLAKGERK